MATNIITAGKTDSTQTIGTLTEGQSVSLYLKPASGSVIPASAYIHIQVQDDGGNWVTAQTLTSQNLPFTNLRGVGAWRAHRPAQEFSVGLFKG